MSSHAALITFPGAEAAELSRKSRYEQGQTRYWRAAQHDNQNRQRASTCRCCRGTGEMLVYIDEPAEPCAKCQQANPWTTNPHDEVPF